MKIKSQENKNKNKNSYTKIKKDQNPRKTTKKSKKTEEKIQ